MERKIYNWKCGARTITLGKRTVVMGILNVTPDSFSDGGSYVDPAFAVERALKIEAEGAGVLDIGGESTRPGAAPVSAEEEIQRTVPIIRAIRARSDIPISIDTMKAAVAAAAIAEGADIINDVSAFEADPEMIRVAAQSEAGIVLMHMKGSPRTMQEHPEYADVVNEVGAYLKKRADWVEQHGIARDRIVLDPGIGFGKTGEHNLELLRKLPAFSDPAYPILVGASRKRFIGHLTGRKNPAERVAGSLGVAAWSALKGAHILRVHDVLDTCDLCRIMDTLLNGDCDAMD